MLSVMEYKSLFDGSKIPVIGLGTWRIGGAMEPDCSKDEESIQAIKEAINLGYIHIDAAEMYGGGHTEELIGEAIKDLDRSTLIITSKVYNTNLKYEDVISSCKKSLERFKTDYLDIYLIHAPNSEIPIEETMKAMDYLVENKIVKYIGVSNFTVEEMKEAQKYSRNKIAFNQIEYNLLTRNKSNYGNNKNMELETVPYCQENNIIIMAERPIERGLLLEPNPLMDKLEEKYNKTKAQIAINWLISKKNIITIPKSTNTEHLKENLGAIGWKLYEEDIELLDKITFLKE